MIWGVAGSFEFGTLLGEGRGGSLGLPIIVSIQSGKEETEISQKASDTCPGTALEVRVGAETAWR